MFNLTNSFDHPTRPGHTIFRFYTKERADLFEKLLQEDHTFFETEIEEEQYRTIYYFGIKNKDAKTVHKKNYLVNAEFRKPTISNVFLRWLIFAFSALIVGLAIVGYIKQN